MRLFRALTHRDFRLFFAGQAISQVGDAIFFVAIAWHALEASGSARGVGLVAGAFITAQVALLVAGGLLVDRLPRRAILVGSDVAQGTLALALAVTTFSGLANIPVLMAFAAAFGAAQAIAMPALTAVVPDIVPREHLTSANSLYQGTRTLSIIVGPIVGGALVALWGPGAAYAADAASFGGSALLLLASAIRPPAPTERRRVLRDALDGARYVARRPWLWMGIAVFSLYNVAAAGARNVALPVYADVALATGAQGLGLMYGGAAAGTLAAYALLGSIDYTRVRGFVAYGGAALGGVGVAALAWAPNAVAAVALVFAMGAMIAGFSLSWETAVQSSVASGMRGRVVSLDMLGSFALLPLAMPAFGVLVDAAGVRPTLLWSGVAMIVIALPGVLSPRARRLGEDAPQEEEDEAAAPGAAASE